MVAGCKAGVLGDTVYIWSVRIGMIIPCSRAIGLSSGRKVNHVMPVRFFSSSRVSGRISELFTICMVMWLGIDCPPGSLSGYLGERKKKSLGCIVRRQ